jgi:hypothetical protein
MKARSLTTKQKRNVRSVRSCGREEEDVGQVNGQGGSDQRRRGGRRQITPNAKKPRRDHKILVIGLHGRRGRLDSGTCKMLEGTPVGASRYFLIRAPNNRWFSWVVEYEFWDIEANEIEIDSAIEWCFQHTGNARSAITKLGIWDALEDAAKLPVPEQRTGFAPRCLNCALNLRPSSRNRPTKRDRILEVLRRAKVPLIGKALASRAGMKNDANFRTILSELVKAGIIKKLEGKRGYVLSCGP